MIYGKSWENQLYEGTPREMDGFCFRKCQKWMMTRGAPISGNLHLDVPSVAVDTVDEVHIPIGDGETVVASCFFRNEPNVGT